MVEYTSDKRKVNGSIPFKPMAKIMQQFMKEIHSSLRTIRNYLLFNDLITIYKVIIIFEFIISIIIFSILFFLLLKRNYINIYCLFLLNIIVLIFLLTFMFQDQIISSIYSGLKFKFLKAEILRHSTSKTTYQALLSCIHTVVELKHGKYFAAAGLTENYYQHKFIFNLFIYKVKIFTIIIFLLTLILGYLQLKTIKISFDKLLLILFPILFCNLILISTQDLVIAYLAIELQNLCLIFLMSIKKKESFTLQFSVRFFILNSVGSLFILLGIVLLYLKLHTVNFYYIYMLLSTMPIYSYIFVSLDILLGLSFIILGLFFKLSVGPFGLWLAEIYEYGLTYGIVIFSLLPKIGYLMLFFNLYLSTSCFVEYWDLILKIFGTISIIIGTFGALSQIYLKRLLAFSSLNYFGYMLLSFIGFTEKSTVICILYFVVYVCISLYIWFIVLYLEKVIKRNILLTDLVILKQHYPYLSTILSLSFVFLAGLPPFYLFILKFYTFYIFIQSDVNYVIFIIFLLCSFISIYYYLKLIKIINFNPTPSEDYKIYRLNSVTIYLMLFYSLLLLSPYAFIFLKNMFIFLSKVLKNYLLNILGSRTNVIIRNKLKILIKNPNIHKYLLPHNTIFELTKRKKAYEYGRYKANYKYKNSIIFDSLIMKKLYFLIRDKYKIAFYNEFYDRSFYLYCKKKYNNFQPTRFGSFFIKPALYLDLFIKQNLFKNFRIHDLAVKEKISHNSKNLKFNKYILSKEKERFKNICLKFFPYRKNLPKWGKFKILRYLYSDFIKYNEKPKPIKPQNIKTKLNRKRKRKNAA